jgi:hypothetical protein
MKNKYIKEKLNIFLNNSKEGSRRGIEYIIHNLNHLIMNIVTYVSSMVYSKNEMRMDRKCLYIIFQGNNIGS